ncbi:DUF5994 family protein [Gordonia sp. NPDC058843]|uniref:DUF5994 family protein n=1 Tax=Gordonia sp. NPDC058843 TaxID=3346648 RepID=UPI0036B2F4AE
MSGNSTVRDAGADTAADQPVVDGSDEQRFSLKPEGSARGSVDGAWWPRTHDLASELSAITQVVGRRLTRLERVGYHLVDWDSAASGKFMFDGQTVRLEGFRTWTPGIVRFMGPGGALTVTVIGVDTDPEVARATMTRATGSTNTESAATLIDTAASDVAGARQVR